MLDFMTSTEGARLSTRHFSRLLRDRDRTYGDDLTRWVDAMSLGWKRSEHVYAGPVTGDAGK